MSLSDSLACVGKVKILDANDLAFGNSAPENMPFRPSISGSIAGYILETPKPEDFNFRNNLSLMDASTSIG